MRVSTEVADLNKNPNTPGPCWTGKAAWIVDNLICPHLSGSSSEVDQL